MLSLWVLIALQDAPLKHHAEPKKCTVCQTAYDKAMGHLKTDLAKMSFPAKMVAGFAFLADPRYAAELKQCVDAAIAWKGRGWKENSHSGNWHPALAAVFLAEVYKFQPEQRIFDAMQEIADYFVKHQEPKNGGWWKWLEGAYTERTDYSVVNHGYVTSLVIGFFYAARQHRVKIPENTFKTGETALMEFTNERGVGYGLPRSGKGGWGDKTAGRGIWVAWGANYVQKLDHPIYTNYKTLLPKQIPNLDQGHHVGAFHGLAVTLGAYMYGPETFRTLTDQWLDKLIRKQEADGGLYIGDDGDAGGEPGLLKGNHGSTAAFALMIRLHQDPNALRPAKKSGPAGGPAVPTGEGKSPFSTKEKPR